MSTRNSSKYTQRLSRLQLRSAFQSLFWSVIQHKKAENGFKLQQLADALGLHKSVVSRMFSEDRQNWTIDKIADLAGALNVELILEARDNQTGAMHTPAGIQVRSVRTLTVPDKTLPNPRSLTTAGIVTICDRSTGDLVVSMAR